MKIKTIIKKMFIGRTAFALLFLSMSLFSETSAQTKTAPEVTAIIQYYLDSLVNADKNLPGLIVHIESPDVGISWSGAAGVAEINTQLPLKPEHTVRIASVTKSFVAASILKLVEKGQLKLNDPITQYLPDSFIRVLDQEYDTKQISIRHLLSHTSGLFDHTMTEQFMSKVQSEPSHRWTRMEQLKGAIEWGDPYGEIGELFHYSDTGYVLLGEIIENIMSESYAKVLRKILNYESLGLNSTWMETLEDKPSTAFERTHQYWQGIDIYDFDPSLDLYGGGGLVSNAKDLASFFYALFNHEVFEDESTLETMMQEIETISTSSRSMDYRLGIYVQERNGVKLFTHGGFWGIEVFYIPSLNSSISVIATEFRQGRARNNILNHSITMLKSLHAAR